MEGVCFPLSYGICGGQVESMRAALQGKNFEKLDTTTIECRKHSYKAIIMKRVFQFDSSERYLGARKETAQNFGWWE